MEPVKILAIDTATPYLVLGTLFSEVSVHRGRRHAETIFDDLDGFLDWSDLRKEELELIVVGEGPGSYTGLRIGAAAALGMARSLAIPVVGVSTLAAVAARRRGLARPALSARSGHVYTALYETKSNNPTAIIEPSKTSVADLPAEACLLFDSPPSGKALAKLGKAAYLSGATGVKSVYL